MEGRAVEEIHLASEFELNYSIDCPAKFRGLRYVL